LSRGKKNERTRGPSRNRPYYVKKKKKRVVEPASHGGREDRGRGSTAGGFATEVRPRDLFLKKNPTQHRFRGGEKKEKWPQLNFRNNLTKTVVTRGDSQKKKKYRKEKKNHFIRGKRGQRIAEPLTSSRGGGRPEKTIPTPENGAGKSSCHHEEQSLTG